MRYVLLILLFCYHSAYGQYTPAELHNASYMLNGGARAALGGQSRNYITLSVPGNCIELVISISTAETDNRNLIKSINQTAQLAAYLSGIPGASAVLPSLTEAVTGTQQYGILNWCGYSNSQCVNLFMSKAPRLCNTPLYYANNTGGTFSIPWRPMGFAETYYLCFMNPKTLSPTAFHIEVTAITKD